MTLRIAQFANILLFALVTGVFWGTWFSADWMAIRDRWEFFHAIRTFASVGALAFAVASVLRETPSSHPMAAAS